jgi:hypothetical protein
MRTIINKAMDGDREVNGRTVHEELPEEVGNFVGETHVTPREIAIRCPAAIVRVVDVGQDSSDVDVNDGGSGGGSVLLALPLAEVVDKLLCHWDVQVGRRKRA